MYVCVFVTLCAEQGKCCFGRGGRKPLTSTHTTHLAPVVPLGVDGVVDGLGPELLGTDGHDGVRVGLALAEHANVLLHEVLRLDHVDAEHALTGERERGKFAEIYSMGSRSNLVVGQFSRKT